MPLTELPISTSRGCYTLIQGVQVKFTDSFLSQMMKELMWVQNHVTKLLDPLQKPHVGSETDLISAKED